MLFASKLDCILGEAQANPARLLKCSNLQSVSCHCMSRASDDLCCCRCRCMEDCLFLVLCMHCFIFKFVLAELDREGIASVTRQHMPSASKYAMPKGGWSNSKYKAVAKHMTFHRLPDELQTGGPSTPVAVLDPTLGQLAHDCLHGDPTQQDCQFTARVAVAISQVFADENERMTTFWELMTSEFGASFARIKLSGAETDGSVLHWKGGLVTNVEVKNEIGTGGGSIHIENAAYAANYATDDANKSVREVSVCPTILIELAGPNMSLSGAVFSDVIACDQLSPMVSLLWQPDSDLMLQAAKCFAAFRNALPKLVKFYDDAHSHALERQLLFPYPTTFPALDGTVVGLSYMQKLSRLCFKGLIKGKDQQHVFIKFCRTYDVNAHRAMADAGCAPQLFGFEQLSPSWCMVVMDFCDAARWEDVAQKPYKALEAAVNTMHNAGFVHGDLRSCNVLVLVDAVYVIDYEWAGKEGAARYPFFMNHEDIDWPEGVGDGKLLAFAHDLWWLKKL